MPDGRRRLPRTGAAVLMLAVLLAAGCADDRDARQFQMRIVDADADTVLAAAEVALKREFLRLNVDRSARRITSEPEEFTTVSDSGTSRDIIRAGTSMRRIAICSVSPRSPSSSLMRLRIDVQRQDTARRSAVTPPEQRLGDAPAYTPLERDAATTRDQNTVWTFVRRDRQLERALLEQVQDLFATEPPEPGSEE